MEYPYKKMTLPKEVANAENGKLPKEDLSKIDIGGQMWHWAAFCFNMMCDAAKKDKITFKNIGDYRPYERQLSMFQDRYSEKDEGRKPQVTRTWNGKKYFLKKGKSPSSTPGTSNHGLGLAIDIDVHDGKVAAWLCKNAPTYGFYLQGSDPKSPEFELWHWQYCNGDKLPDVAQKLIDYFKSLNKK